ALTCSVVLLFVPTRPGTGEPRGDSLRQPEHPAGRTAPPGSVSATRRSRRARLPLGQPCQLTRSAPQHARRERERRRPRLRELPVPEPSEVLGVEALEARLQSLRDLDVLARDAARLLTGAHRFDLGGQ